MTALLLILSLAAQAPAPQAEAERLFRLGNALHAEGDFRGAAAAYEGALATGWTSAALHLNLGSAYAEAGDLGRAVLHAERARRLAPRDAAVRHNLEVLARRVGAGPSPPGEAVAAWLSERAGAGGVAVALLAVYLLVLALAGSRAWTRRPDPWRRRALVVLVPLGLALAAAAALTARYEARPRAVVVAAEAPLRAGPSAEAAVTAAVPEGRIVAVGERRGGWVAVALPGGPGGWAEAAAIEEL